MDAGREAWQHSSDEIASGLDDLDLEPGQIDDSYQLDSWTLIKKVVVDVTAGAIAKLSRP